MEPLLLVCGGCGAKVRAGDPDRARTRDCPRCATALAPAVAEALRLRVGPRFEPPASGSRGALASAPGRSRLVFLAAVLLLGSSVIHLAVSTRTLGGDYDPPLTRHPTSGGVGPITGTPPRAIEPPRLNLDAPADPEPGLNLALLDPPGVTADLPSPSVPTSIPAEPAAGLRVAQPAPVPVVAADDSPTEASAAGSTPAQAPGEPRRLLVRDAEGEAVVAREHGMLKDQMAVVLPDGTIGWPMTQVFTDDPFVPDTIDKLERTLLNGDYAAFRVVKTEHYLVFYQSSERFARDSADLLEKLYEKLTGALRKQKLPIVETEFPLVAVIFRSEDEFRANREVAPDVQAYYELMSNRIFFFEKSKRDTASPEVSALRKPQTVAHEGTHQLLHNVGIQRRMSPWPLWLVEGLAEYCSPPTVTRKGVGWGGLGQINPIHLTTIRDLDDPMTSTVRGGPRVPDARDRGQPLVEYLATRSDLTPTDYALSWGLTHYLALERVDQLVAYIRKLNRLLPFETRTPDEQLADFREAFGENLGKLDAQVARHLGKLKVPDAQALPFYAVLVEQPVSPGAVRRMAMVSQSPSVIRQWVETASQMSNGQVRWHAVPHPNRTRAMMTADNWTQRGR